MVKLRIECVIYFCGGQHKVKPNWHSSLLALQDLANTTMMEVDVNDDIDLAAGMLINGN